MLGIPPVTTLPKNTQALQHCIGPFQLDQLAPAVSVMALASVMVGFRELDC